MTIERPDLEGVDPDVRAYIEALETELAQLRGGEPTESAAPVFEEEPTTLNVITISAGGIAKRTPRHLYTRQRRGGMGVFDLDTPEEDPPAFLLVADESQHLILFTDRARAMRVPVGEIVETPVRDRGASSLTGLALLPGESLALVIPQGGPYLALLTHQGHVKWYGAHLLGDHLNPETIFYDVSSLGPPVAACWTNDQVDLFITTRHGQGIRFPARQVPMQGCLGIRLNADDEAVSIAGVKDESGVLLLGADGKGTIRSMSGFRANKAPGGGGKVAMKTDHLIGGAVVQERDDIFAISRLSKIIRFCAEEIPPKEGVVQGVNCMTLRADEVAAMTISTSAG